MQQVESGASLSPIFITLRMLPSYLTETFTIILSFTSLSVYSMFHSTRDGEGEHNQCPDHSFQPIPPSISLLQCQTEFQEGLMGPHIE